MKGRQDPKARRPRLFSDYFLTGALRVNFRSQRKPIYRTVEANFGGSSTLLSFFFNDRCWKSNSAPAPYPSPHPPSTFSSWSLVGGNWCRSRAGRSSFLGDLGSRHWANVGGELCRDLVGFWPKVHQSNLSVHVLRKSIFFSIWLRWLGISKKLVWF